MGEDPDGIKAEPFMGDGAIQVAPTEQAAVPPPTSSLATHALPNGGPQWASSLPPGWATAVSPNDGRIYYWEKSTGQTSWTHPMAPKSVPVAPPVVAIPVDPNKNNNTPSGIFANRNMKNNKAFYDTPLNASRRPNNHQCYALVAVVLFFPIGLCGLFQSLQVDEAWDDGRFVNAIHYSRRAILYSRLACAFGVFFWIYWIFFREPGGIFDIEWPQFD